MQMKVGKILYVAMAACIAVLATQCAPARRAAVPTPGARAVQRGQVWQLVEMKGKAMPQTGEVFTLLFNPEAGTFHGNTPCNRYFGDYGQRQAGIDGDATRYELTVSNLGSGNTRCAEPTMNTEERYLSLLAKSGQMVVGAATLTLMQHGKAVLKYELQ